MYFFRRYIIATTYFIALVIIKILFLYCICRHWRSIVSTLYMSFQRKSRSFLFMLINPGSSAQELLHLQELLPRNYSRVFTIYYCTICNFAFKRSIICALITPIASLPVLRAMIFALRLVELFITTIVLFVTAIISVLVIGYYSLNWNKDSDII